MEQATAGLICSNLMIMSIQLIIVLQISFRASCSHHCFTIQRSLNLPGLWGKIWTSWACFTISLGIVSINCNTIWFGFIINWFQDLIYSVFRFHIYNFDSRIWTTLSCWPMPTSWVGHVATLAMEVSDSWALLTFWLYLITMATLGRSWRVHWMADLVQPPLASYPSP